MHLSSFRHYALITVTFLASGITGFGQAVGTKLWSFQTGGKVTAPPALGHDRTVYVASESHRLFALSPTGNKRWEFLTADAITACPVVTFDGSILVGSTDGVLYSVSTNGTERWRFPTSNGITEPPAVTPDGTAYIVSTDGFMYAVNPNGSEKWRFKTDTLPRDHSVPAPSIGMDGTIYVSQTKYLGSSIPRFVALNPDGTVKWAFSPAFFKNVETSAVLNSDGTIYFNSGSLYALSPEGTERWTTALSTPVIGPVGRLSGILFQNPATIRPDGGSLWISYSLPANVTTTPAIAEDGTLYYGSERGALFALNGTDGALAWGFETGSAIYSAPLISSTGTVLFGADDGNLYAVKGTTGPLASPWPMYRGNAQRTGALSNTVLSETELSLRMYPGLLINGNLGASYRIEYRTDLDAPWEFLANVTIDATPYRFYDLNHGSPKARYYRAVQLP